MKNILFIFGTRPEAIKLAPLYHEFKKDRIYNVSVCITAQHRELLDEILNFFNIHVDYDLNIMRNNQTLTYITITALEKINKILKNHKFDLIFIQGDTTTTFVGSLSGFYNKIKVAHIEAGLRSYQKYNPYPEEINRVLTSKLVDFHFAPTEIAKNNLNKENIYNNVWVVGNTAIDSLYFGMELLKNNEHENYKYFKNIDFSKKIILVTTHRRENFGDNLKSICRAIKEISYLCTDVEIIIPIHPNPNVKNAINKYLKKIKNIHLFDPFVYPKFIWLMNKSYLILTDSGGIQEEAPSFGKPVLVLRDVTERNEGIISGNALLVGTKIENIRKITLMLLKDKNAYYKMANNKNPYGDGKASEKIFDIINKRFQ